MTTKRYEKLAVGDLTYVYPSTRLSEGGAGIVTRVLIGQEGDEPHIVFQRPDGSESPIWDYSKVGFGGGPPRVVNQASAIVKWIFDAETLQPVPSDKSHQEWPVERETNGWALARDPWEKRSHWLTSGSEYRLWVGGNGRCHVFIMQTLLVP